MHFREIKGSLTTALASRRKASLPSFEVLSIKNELLCKTIDRPQVVKISLCLFWSSLSCSFGKFLSAKLQIEVDDSINRRFRCVSEIWKLRPQEGVGNHVFERGHLSRALDSGK